MKEWLSHEEGVSLSLDPSTSVEVGEKTRHIALPWTLLGNAAPVVDRILHKSLGKYSNKLEGVPLTFGNVRYVEGSGRIVKDQPVMHLYVLADYTVFRPKYGDILTGKVSRAGTHAVTINPYRGVSVVGRLGGECTESPEVGDLVHVKVSKSRTHAKFFSVLGNVIQIIKQDVKDVKPTKLLFGNSADKESFDPLKILNDAKKEEEKRIELKTEDEIPADTSNVTDSNVKDSKKSKKRKRRVSASSGTESTPKRKSKKIKTENLEADEQ